MEGLSRRQKQREKRRRFVARILVFLGLMLIGLLYWLGGILYSNSELSAKPLDGLYKPAADYDYTLVPLAEIADTRCLELVNLDHPVAGYPEERSLQPLGRYLSAESEEVFLRPAALDALVGMYRDLSTAGLSFTVSSGYRGYQEQEQLYLSGEANLVMPPNYSEHHTGLAVDIPLNDFSGVRQLKGVTVNPGQWLHQNAWRYGLIVRYPAAKSHLTGIDYEPWHFRYLGLPHSWYIYQSGLCFEEYLQYLSQSGGYRVTLEGTTYIVRYQMPIEGMIELPQGLDFSVSGDNQGGYIVTIRE